MKTKMLLLGLPVLFLGLAVPSLFSSEKMGETKLMLASIEGCVFMTTMGEQASAGYEVFKTDENGTGVMLYAVSGSVRGTAKDARKAKEYIAKAEKEGKLANKEVNVANLLKAGMDEAEAAAYTTSYNVYNSAKIRAQDENVLNGFGNNGGEEFLSFLQTGESLVIKSDND